MEEAPVLGQLEEGHIVRLTLAQWKDWQDRFRVVEQHDTGLSGQLWVVESSAGVAVVEEPSSAERVLRPLPSLEAAHSFVAERLATYDRMWDGCGCKIDYYR